MLRFTLRRIGLSLITLVILVFIIFLLTTVLPDDPARKLAGGAFASPEAVEAKRIELGLDDAKSAQFGRLIKSVVTFNFGDSWAIDGASVTEIVRPAIWNSAKLVMFALILTIPISILAGVFAARHKDSFADRSIVTVGLASASIPDFVSGVILQYILGVRFKIFPAVTSFPDDAGIFANLEQMFLPALAIVAVYFGYIARISRAGTITALDADYTRTATMKGLSSTGVVRKHVLRNAMQPTVTVTATQMGYLFGGLVGLERVFNYPGLGRAIVRAAQGPDVPVLQASVLAVAIIFMISTLFADLLIAWMNPRIRSVVGSS